MRLTVPKNRYRKERYRYTKFLWLPKKGFANPFYEWRWLETATWEVTLEWRSFSPWWKTKHLLDWLPTEDLLPGWRP